MKKDALIEKLKVGITIEKTAIPLYMRHLNNPHFMAAFSNEKRQEIKENLRRLCDQSRQHKKRLEALIKRITESDRDVF